MKTPWGNSDFHENKAYGIDFYGTPSHGGFFLDPKLNSLMNPALFENKRWGMQRKGGWYEEDCDAYFVILRFPELFKQEDVNYAKEMIPQIFPKEAEALGLKQEVKS